MKLPAEAPDPQLMRKTRAVARRLQEAMGPRPWRKHLEPVDELVATILSQHTSDVNTARAFASLRSAFPTWYDVIGAPTAAVTEAIRSGGLANIKAPRIQAVLREVEMRFDGFDLTRLSLLAVDEARAELTSLQGVGPKTASCVLLFSLGLPAMPVDTHVHRVTGRLGLIDAGVSAEAAHRLLEAQLGGDRDEVYAFHMDLIGHGRRVCTARRPFCEQCVLAECCDYFANRNNQGA